MYIALSDTYPSSLIIPLFLQMDNVINNVFLSTVFNKVHYVLLQWPDRCKEGRDYSDNRHKKW